MLTRSNKREEKDTGIYLLRGEPEQRLSYNASGEISPRALMSKFSKLLTTLNALADLISSPNSDLESIFSCMSMSNQ